MTWSELLRRVPVSEFIYWIAFFTLEEYDRQRSIENAQDRAEAMEMARQMAR